METINYKEKAETFVRGQLPELREYIPAPCPEARVGCLVAHFTTRNHPIQLAHVLRLLVEDWRGEFLEVWDLEKDWNNQEERDEQWRDAIQYLIANSEGSQDWYNGLRACRSIEIKRKNKGEDMTREELEAEGDWNEEPEIPFEIEMQ